jgi:aminomethyltransferase
MAMVPIEDTPLGTELVVDVPDGPRDAWVVEKPFLDPRKHTPKG